MLWQDIEGKKQCQNIHPQPTELTEGKQPSLAARHSSSISQRHSQGKRLDYHHMAINFPAGRLKPGTPQTRDPPRDDSHF